MTGSFADYRAYLFDVDGTLIRPDRALPGVAEALDALKARGKAIRAVTNNSSLTHHAIAERFRRFGLPLDDHEVFSALTATARFVAHERPGARVYAFGTPGMRQELEDAGLIVRDDDEVDYVVTGRFPEINDRAITTAMRALLRGARFVAVNVDRYYVGTDGLVPGAGVAAGALASAVGRQPDVIVGKPSITIVEEAVSSVGFAPGDCLFVGDNLEADVVAAHAAGLPALLVLTGVTTRAEFEASGVAVEHVLDSVADLPAAIDGRADLRATYSRHRGQRQ
ncbi:MAG: HAD-IIA family hydrolase [Chloroflexota bacterium]|nr:HAD-IIA family hydrolase [Chloroflexota bacterium]